MSETDSDSSEKDADLQTVETTWKELVLICKDCDRGEHLADGLKKRWKKRDVRDVRVLRTSCLDVCKDDRITCVIVQEGAIKRFTIASDAKTGVAEKALAAELLTVIPDAEDASAPSRPGLCRRPMKKASITRRLPEI